MAKKDPSILLLISDHRVADLAIAPIAELTTVVALTLWSKSSQNLPTLFTCMPTISYSLEVHKSRLPNGYIRSPVSSKVPPPESTNQYVIPNELSVFSNLSLWQNTGWLLSLKVLQH